MFAVTGQSYTHGKAGMKVVSQDLPTWVYFWEVNVGMAINNHFKYLPPDLKEGVTPLFLLPYTVWTAMHYKLKSGNPEKKQVTRQLAKNTLGIDQINCPSLYF